MKLILINGVHFYLTLFLHEKVTLSGVRVFLFSVLLLNYRVALKFKLQASDIGVIF